MTDTPRVLSLASAAALLLALSQPLLATEEPAGSAAETTAPTAAAPVAETAAPAEAAPVAEAVSPGPAAEAPAATAEPTPTESAHARAEARRAKMDAERNKRYEDLRQRAAEVGLELPETPPWESAPEMPSMPSHANMTPPDWDAMREAMRERFKSMTPEERKAMREAHWKKMRERAAERGMEMPETSPWEEAEKRYKAAQEQFDRYRKIVDEMTEEQLEAARALFGHKETPPSPMQQPMASPQMPPQGYGYGPQGGYPGYGYGPQGGPGAMGRAPMPYYEEGMEQAPPPPRGMAPY